VRDNPFTPSFGTLPAVLVGRDEVLAGLAPLFTRFTKNDIHWATHLRAHRGAGKTVLLDQIQDAATRAGWWVLQEDAGAGAPLTAKIINRSLTRMAELDPPRRGRRITSVKAFGAGVGLEPTPPQPATVTSVRDVLDAVVGAEANGVLVTIDEVHQAPEKALNELGNAAQHLHRNGRPLVLVLAGLPRPERAREPTFLGRAWQPELGRLEDVEVERGLVETAATAGGRFEPLALRRAVELAAGEPFLLQLVGYHAWDEARRRRITVRDVDASAAAARSTYNRAVTAQMVGAVSPDQRAFLASMARHGPPTRLAEVRADHAWSQSQVGVYRQRLIDAGLVAAAGWGLVDFAIPGVAEVVADDL
jgi:hypothetical protein